MGAKKLTYYNKNHYYPFGMLLPNRHEDVGEYRYGFNGMEKDDEVSGEGNSYDFGARLYNPRVGRWFSCDPHKAKYPNQSPYNFAYNSPIYVKDADGRDGIATIEGNEIVVRSTIYFYNADSDGPAISTETANSVGGDIENSWNEANGNVTIDGKTYKVRFEITAIGISKNQAIEQHVNTKQGESYVAIGDGEGVKNSFMPSNSGYIRTTDIGTTTPEHEYSHNLGMDGHPDSEGEGCLVYFNETEGEKSGIDGTIMIGTPNGAYDNNGKLINPEERKVTQGDIDRLGLDKKLSGGNTRTVLGAGGIPVLYDNNGSVTHQNGKTSEQNTLDMFHGMSLSQFVKKNAELIENGVNPREYWENYDKEKADETENTGEENTEED